MLSYFGGADAVLPPDFAIADARRLGANATFYRLFPVPGMAHCQGGITPTAFGQSLEAPALADTPAHDIRRALEAWVEGGVAPAVILADASTQGSRHIAVLKFASFGDRVPGNIRQ